MSVDFSVVKKLLPKELKRWLKVLVMETGDLVDKLTGKRGKHVPPTRLMFDGSANIDYFLQGGEDFLTAFLALLKPKPSYRILDIGSGIGRHTLPLTRYLNSKGSYEGFEIVEAGVEWCIKHITTRFPNFRFTLVDIHNGSYNPKGKVMPEDFVFPYPDDSFDVVVALSVFTHMTAPGVRHYLKEINRVLKPGGKTLLTYFLINQESEGLLGGAKNTQPFMKTNKGYWTTDKELPELAIAYGEKEIKKYYKEVGLKISQVYYGSWCGRKNYSNYQDEIVAVKGR